MEDYIFLIIAVVISIFGAINQNKKKMVGDNPLAEKKERPRNFFMDQLLGEDFLAEPVKEVKPKVKIRPAMKKDPLVSATTASQSVQSDLRFKSTLPDRKLKNLQSALRKPRIEEVEAESDIDDSPGYLDDFSLRKAFVYSEIMTRKYE